jgi:hypothetical protein
LRETWYRAEDMTAMPSRNQMEEDKIEVPGSIPTRVVIQREQFQSPYCTHQAMQ